MTKTDLIERQRRFEWKLGREQAAEAAAALVRGKTHDLLNLVQVVKLATTLLEKRCDESGQEFITSLTRAAAAAETTLRELMQATRPTSSAGRAAAVGAAVTSIVDELRFTIPIELDLAIAPETTTALTADELSHLVIGLALDAAAAPRIELHVRERMIAGRPWVELVRGTELPATPGELPFDLRAVEVLVARAGGELSCAERRGGGSELVVALPTSASA
jgi:hypothetical protein